MAVRKTHGHDWSCYVFCPFLRRLVRNATVVRRPSNWDRLKITLRCRSANKKSKRPHAARRRVYTRRHGGTGQARCLAALALQTIRCQMGGGKRRNTYSRKRLRQHVFPRSC